MPQQSWPGTDGLNARRVTVPNPRFDGRGMILFRGLDEFHGKFRPGHSTVFQQRVAVRRRDGMADDLCDFIHSFVRNHSISPPTVAPWVANDYDLVTGVILQFSGDTRHHSLPTDPLEATRLRSARPRCQGVPCRRGAQATLAFSLLAFIGHPFRFKDTDRLREVKAVRRQNAILT